MTKDDDVDLELANVGTFDPRSEADAHIASALQIVIDAGDGDDDAETETRRDYTSDELDTLFFALEWALIQLKKLPGGAEAHDWFRREQVKRAKRVVPSTTDQRLQAAWELEGDATIGAGTGRGTYTRAVAERRRNRPVQDREAELKTEAIKIIQRTFGTSVDLSAGTMGATLVTMVVTDLENQGKLRDKLLALAVTIRPSEAGE
jgi:hypothetical protein